MVVITLGHTPILPSLVHIGSVVALRRGGEMYNWCDFFFFFYSRTRVQTKRGGLDERKMAQKTRIRVHITLFGGQHFLPQLLGGLFAPKLPNLGPGIGISMQMKMLNISKTVSDRDMIPSATPTKSWITNSMQLK